MNSENDRHIIVQRAIELLGATCNFIKDNNFEEYTTFYDETTCDGYCLVTDCEAIIEELKTL